MTASRREFLGGACALTLAGVGPALAQYPERGVTLIVPYGAGGRTASACAARGD